jgi:chromate transport protein ChrA
VTGPESVAPSAPKVRPGGLRLWFGVIGGIAAWAAHLLALTALVQFTCNRPGTRWVLDAITVVTAVITLLAILVCVGILRSTSDDDEDDPSLAGRTRFLGLFGLITGVVNLALILLEGSYAWFISPCA